MQATEYLSQAIIIALDKQMKVQTTFHVNTDLIVIISFFILVANIVMWLPLCVKHFGKPYCLFDVISAYDFY